MQHLPRADSLDTTLPLTHPPTPRPAGKGTYWANAPTLTAIEFFLMVRLAALASSCFHLLTFVCLLLHVEGGAAAQMPATGWRQCGCVCQDARVAEEAAALPAAPAPPPPPPPPRHPPPSRAQAWVEIRRLQDMYKPGSTNQDPIFSGNKLPDGNSPGYPGASPARVGDGGGGVAQPDPLTAAPPPPFHSHIPHSF